MSVHVHVTNLFVVVWWISMSFCSPYLMWLWNFSPSSGQDCKQWLFHHEVCVTLLPGSRCEDALRTEKNTYLGGWISVTRVTSNVGCHQYVTNMSPSFRQDTSRHQDPLDSLSSLSKTLRHSVMNFWHILARHTDSAVAETSAAKIPSCNLHPRRFRGKAAIGNLQDRN